MEKEMNIVVDEGILYYGSFNFSNLDTLMASLEGKELGLAKGSLNFEAKPEFRDIEFAGSKERKIAGMRRIRKWEVKSECEVLDLNDGVLGASLVKKDSDTSSTKFDVYIPKSDLNSEDYKDLLIVGKKHGSGKDVVIHIMNTFNTEGITFSLEDNNEASTKMVFEGHYAFKNNEPPFKIYMGK